MQVLVLYESRRGFTLTVARAIRDEINARGHQAFACPFGTPDVGTWNAADAVIVGTWIEGFIVARVRPADGAMRGIRELPDLAGRPVAIYCTYDVSPRDSLGVLAEALEERGGRPLLFGKFKRRRKLAAVDVFAERALEAFASATAGSPS